MSQDTTAATNVPIAQYTISNDIVNSAPLVVVYSGGVGTSRVFVSTAKGFLYVFSSGTALASGPLYVTKDLPAIPDEDLPMSTYCFLSVTPAGTLLGASRARLYSEK